MAASEKLEKSVWFTGALLTFLATGEETGGQFSMIEEVFRKGVTALAPMHVHSREEESFYVLDGEMTFYVGDEVIPAGRSATMRATRPTTSSGSLPRSPDRADVALPASSSRFGLRALLAAVVW